MSNKIFCHISCNLNVRKVHHLLVNQGSNPVGNVTSLKTLNMHHIDVGECAECTLEIAREGIGRDVYNLTWTILIVKGCQLELTSHARIMLKHVYNSIIVNQNTTHLINRVIRIDLNISCLIYRLHNKNCICHREN